MKSFACSNCGDCCGPVPVNKLELSRIQKSLSRMPKREVERLKNQKRSPMTCMFRDIENDKCGVYNFRPEICKMFGFYEGMKCPSNPEHDTESREEGVKRLSKGGKQVGILTLQINWGNVMEVRG